MTWSSDEKLIATLSNFFKRVTVWNANRGEKVFEVDLRFPYTNALAFSPDGKYLLTGSDGNRSPNGKAAATLWDVGRRAAIREIDGPFPDLDPADNLAKSFVFSRSGKLVALIAQHSVVIYETRNWTITTLLPIPADIPKAIAFSPDDTILAVGTVGGDVLILDIGRRAFRTRFNAYDKGSGGVVSLAFSPDGQSLATGSGLPLNTRNPDGTWHIGAPADPIRVWHSADGTRLRTFSGKLLEVFALKWSSDSRYIASASGDNTVRLWELSGDDGGRLLLTFSTPSLSVVFDSSGKRIAAIGDDLAVIADIPH